MGIFGDLFDSPLKLLIVAVVILVLFGSKKLPFAARSLGQSMRILKKEVSGLHEDDDTVGFDQAPQAAQAAPAQLAATSGAPSDPQAQIDALQEQLRTLQQTVTANGAADASRTQSGAQQTS